MACWHSHVEAGEQFFKSVEKALLDNSIKFDEVTLYPWRSSGGRSNGVTANFYRRDCPSINVTIYEYWNSDEICLQFNTFNPCYFLNDKYDIPHVKLNSEQLHIAMLEVQFFLLYWFGEKFPEDMYCQRGFGGMYRANQNDMDLANDDVVQKVVIEHMVHCEKCDSLVRMIDNKQKDGTYICSKCMKNNTLT